jgi:hypothetical protein
METNMITSEFSGRPEYRRVFPGSVAVVGSTVPGVGPGGWRASALAESQESHAARQSSTVVYRIYTEDTLALEGVIAPLFDSFSVTHVTGYYRGTRERGAVVEIVGTSRDASTVRRAARAIIATGQAEVLITLQSSRGLTSESVTR